MTITQSRKKVLLPAAVGATFFVLACVLQAVDNFVKSQSFSVFLGLLSDLIFFGLLAYWTASVLSRVFDKSIRFGVTVAIALTGMILFIRFLKYHVFYDATSTRYLWYSYYVPQCLAPAVMLITLSAMGRKDERFPKKLFLLFVPAALLILLVFTNDLHQQVFSFPKGLKYSNQIYNWEWGYYLILCWIALLYLAIGGVLFVKCRISQCRKKAWIPLILLVACFALCVLREVFDPSFIRMPETVVFSVVVVFESLIRTGFIPSNVHHEELFYLSDVSASIADKNLNVVLSSQNAPKITKQQALAAQDGTELSKDLVLRSKKIRGGEVFWTEDFSVINKINLSLAEINQTLSEEGDLIAAENKLKQQRSKIEEQNNLYKGIFDVFRPHVAKIQQIFGNAQSQEEKDEALRLAVLFGVYLKRRSNLAMLANNGQAQLSELLFAMRESVDALSFYGVAASVVCNGEGVFPIEQLTFAYEFFEDCVEYALPNLSACLVRLSANGQLNCRIALDNAQQSLPDGWRKNQCETLSATVLLQKQDETLYATLSFGEKEAK